MKIATEDFARLAAAAATTAKDKSPIPACTMVRLEATGGTLAASATDMEYWLSMSAPCEGDMAPAMVLASKLNDVASKLKSDTVELSLDGDALHLKAKGSKRKIAAMPADSFPQLPATGGDSVAVDAARLKECFAYCLPYTKAGGREYERGVRLEGNRMRATDGATIGQINYGDIELPVATVPIAWIKAFSAVVPDGEVNMIVSDKAVAAEWPEGRISGPLIDGAYPDTDRATPRNTETNAVLDAQALQAAVAGVRALSDGRSAVGLNIEADGVDVFAKSQQGEAVDRIEGNLAGEPLMIGFNADYLDRVMRGFGKASVQIGANGAAGAALFTSNEASDRQAVVMPMRI